MQAVPSGTRAKEKDQNLSDLDERRALGALAMVKDFGTLSRQASSLVTAKKCAGTSRYRRAGVPAETQVKP